MKNKINLHFIFVLIAAVLWGTAGVFVKSAVSLGIKEMQIVFFRALISALVYAALIFQAYRHVHHGREQLLACQAFCLT